MSHITPHLDLVDVVNGMVKLHRLTAVLLRRGPRHARRLAGGMQSQRGVMGGARRGLVVAVDGGGRSLLGDGWRWSWCGGGKAVCWRPLGLGLCTKRMFFCFGFFLLCTLIRYMGFRGILFLCLVGCFSMITWTPAVLSVLYACVLYFCICTCSAQLSMFHMERRSKNTLIIIIIIITKVQWRKLTTGNSESVRTVECFVGCLLNVPAKC